MLPALRISLASLAIFLAGCASIPPEAPELSMQLGSRISAIEASHQRLVERFFAERRRQVDEFVKNEWVPVLADEFFKDPKVDAIWKQVVASQNPADRLKFITLTGPRLQDAINRKRLELVAPLEDLEREVKSKLKVEYDQARAINNTLTSFLSSAAKVEENRKRYLDLVGVRDAQLDRYLNDTDEAVTGLVEKVSGVGDKAKDAQAFIDKIQKIRARIQS
jgi:hypothetical protein